MDSRKKRRLRESGGHGDADLLKYTKPVHVPARKDVEDAYLIGERWAVDFIERYGKSDRAFLRSLVREVPHEWTDPTDGYAPWSGGGFGGSGQRNLWLKFRQPAHIEKLLRDHGCISENRRGGFTGAGAQLVHRIIPADAAISARPDDFEQARAADLEVSSESQADNASCSRVENHRREVPEWLYSDAKIKSFILHRWPHLNNGLSGDVAYVKEAAQMAACLYRWRALVSEEENVDELGYSVAGKVRDADRHYLAWQAGEDCGCGNPRRQPQVPLTRDGVRCTRAGHDLTLPDAVFVRVSRSRLTKSGQPFVQKFCRACSKDHKESAKQRTRERKAERRRARHDVRVLRVPAAQVAASGEELRKHTAGLARRRHAGESFSAIPSSS